MSALADWVMGVGAEFGLLGFVIFLRTGAMVMLMPGFGEQYVPMRVKLAIAIAMTFVVLPTVTPITSLSEGRIFALMATEPLNGLLLGVGLRLFVIALQTAGAIAAQAASLSQFLGGAAAEPMPAIGHVFLAAGLCLAFVTGFHVRAVQFLVISYDMLPMGRVPGPSIVSEWGLGQIAQSFALAFRLAAPFVLASTIYYIALGVINRAMPQLMVAFVGAPLITGGALLILCFVTPAILSVWLTGLDGFLANPGGLQR